MIRRSKLFREFTIMRSHFILHSAANNNKISASKMSTMNFV